MSLKRTFFSSVSLIWLAASVSDATAQYRPADRYFPYAQTQQRPGQAVQQRSPQSNRPQQQVSRPQQTQQPEVQSQQPPRLLHAAQPHPPAAPAASQSSQKMPEPQAKAVPLPPLTEEQIAAKAAVDELLSREPALAAAKERPDPALYRAAVAKHNAQEQQLAALKARQEADEAKRRALEEKNKARDEAKLAALKNPPDTQQKKTRHESAKQKAYRVPSNQTLSQRNR